MEKTQEQICREVRALVDSWDFSPYTKEEIEQINELIRRRVPVSHGGIEETK